MIGPHAGWQLAWGSLLGPLWSISLWGDLEKIPRGTSSTQAPSGTLSRPWCPPQGFLAAQAHACHAKRDLQIFFWRCI